MFFIMTSTPDILKKIIARKEQEIIEHKNIVSFESDDEKSLR
jgi:hypothetical protein